RLKTLKGMTPYQFIVKSWGDNPDVFLDEPCHLNLGLYT
ncbi:MAG: IS481 family transposase, partial [Defluviitaleaceae bacterium]|nr:IS481 family transposase [Defluviitaleaceae bacterium]MCL2357660.1 IS481 family transposase [Defluviitaleaceae bacterium]